MSVPVPDAALSATSSRACHAVATQGVAPSVDEDGGSARAVLVAAIMPTRLALDPQANGTTTSVGPVGFDAFECQCDRDDALTRHHPCLARVYHTSSSACVHTNASPLSGVIADRTRRCSDRGSTVAVVATSPGLTTGSGGRAAPRGRCVAVRPAVCGIWPCGRLKRRTVTLGHVVAPQLSAQAIFPSAHVPVITGKPDRPPPRAAEWPARDRWCRKRIGVGR